MCETFNCKRIKLAISYWQNRDHQVIGFVPLYLIEPRPGAHPSLRQEDISYLRGLLQAGLLALTPSQSYDDSFAIEYATQKNGFIVTNDMFRDHFSKITKKEVKKLKQRLIAFSFVNDEFLPDPDSHFFK